MLLIKILAEIGTCAHVPRDKVLFVLVKEQMLMAVRFVDPVPEFRKDITRLTIMRKR
jgi:hypothetical protein